MCIQKTVHRFNFFVESLKHAKSVGTFIPSLRASAKKMTKPVDFSRARILVELGGGTGAITREILARMHPEAQLLVFETNPVFVKILIHIGDSRMEVIDESAEHLLTNLETRNMREIDYVISTLPIALMLKSTKKKIYDAIIRVLRPDGRYIQIQYSLLSRKELKDYFPTVTIDFTPWNIPPAFIYICKTNK